MSQRPPVSVVVPFLGTDAELHDLVGRLATIQVRIGDEVIVADNRTTDPSPTMPGPVLRHPAGGVRSPGFARNRGAARATGEWFVFIDADTEPEPGLLDAYFDPLPHPGTAVLGGGIVDVAISSGAGEPIGVAARYAASRGHLDQRVTLGRDAFAYAQTANCAIRRDPFSAVGGFDESIRAAEDADLCFRLAEEGWGIEARPAARVRHRTRATLAASLRQLARHGAGAAWCNRRHPGSFPPPTPAGLAARLAASASQVVLAGVSGDKEKAAFAALDGLDAVAFEAGRFMSNRADR